MLSDLVTVDSLVEYLEKKLQENVIIEMVHNKRSGYSVTVVDLTNLSASSFGGQTLVSAIKNIYDRDKKC